MEPLHHLEMTLTPSSTDDRILRHQLELHHAWRQERRDARQDRRQRVTRWLRIARARRPVGDGVIAPT